jgi:hypothetical protein
VEHNHVLGLEAVSDADVTLRLHNFLLDELLGRDDLLIAALLYRCIGSPQIQSFTHC